MSGEAPLTYGDAGVSLEAADEVVRRISAAVESTHTKDVLGAWVASPACTRPAPATPRSPPAATASAPRSCSVPLPGGCTGSASTWWR